jgi:hypothetical protein
MRAIFGFRISSVVSSRLALLLTAAVALIVPRVTSAQGCAMCYTSAAAAKQAGIQALQNGIVILLVPPLVMFAGIIWLAYRSSTRWDESETGWEQEGRPTTPGGRVSRLSPLGKCLPENGQFEYDRRD